jgi:hypothetical protein
MHVYLKLNEGTKYEVKFVADNTDRYPGLDIGSGWRITSDGLNKRDLAYAGGAREVDISVPQPWLDAEPDYMDSYRNVVWSYDGGSWFGVPLDVRTLYPKIVEEINKVARLEITIDTTHIDTWFERDRQYIALKTETEILVSWHDEAVDEAVNDGFLTAKGFILGKLHDKAPLHTAALAYYLEYLFPIIGTEIRVAEDADAEFEIAEDNVDDEDDYDDDYLEDDGDEYMDDAA